MLKGHLKKSITVFIDCQTKCINKHKQTVRCDEKSDSFLFYIKLCQYGKIWFYNNNPTIAL